MELSCCPKEVNGARHARCVVVSHKSTHVSKTSPRILSYMDIATSGFSIDMLEIPCEHLSCNDAITVVPDVKYQHSAVEIDLLELSSRHRLVTTN